MRWPGNETESDLPFTAFKADEKRTLPLSLRPPSEINLVTGVVTKLILFVAIVHVARIIPIHDDRLMQTDAAG